MKHVSVPSVGSVTVTVSSPWFGQSAPGGDGQKSGQLSGDMVVRDAADAPAATLVGAAVDPHRVAAEEPIRWAAFINEVYADDRLAMQHFNVSERTVRLWREGWRTPRSTSRTIAERRHPEACARIMHGDFAARGLGSR